VEHLRFTTDFGYACAAQLVLQASIAPLHGNTEIMTWFSQYR